jgi:hypothetical protein
MMKRLITSRLRLRQSGMTPHALLTTTSTCEASGGHIGATIMIPYLYLDPPPPRGEFPFDPLCHPMPPPNFSHTQIEGKLEEH